MIDQAFQKAAEKIQAMLFPELNDFFSDLISNNQFQTRTVDELQIACIKIALEALVLVLILWITTRSSRKAKAKKEKTYAAPSTGKKFKPKKWNPDGSYWDEDRKKWVDPDY